MGTGKFINIATNTNGSQLSIENSQSEAQAIENENRVIEEVDAHKYQVTESLRQHIENADTITSGRSGIKGAHNKENFIQAAKEIGAKITGSVPNSQLSGVEKISYKMPLRDKAGNCTGGYRNNTMYKTVYDPKCISTEEYLKRGIEAANNSAKNSGYNRLGREWDGIDNQGVRWHGYCNKNGVVTSFYPED